MDWSEWECESLMDAYRTDAEASYELTGQDESIRIDVHKLGGGAVGKTYRDDWICELFIGEQLIVSDRINTGMPKTHVQVSAIFADFLTEWAERQNPGEGVSMPELAPHAGSLALYVLEVDDMHGGVS